MFGLTREEIIGISQSVTSSNLRFSKRVTAFTEQGVAMLSSVLRSKRAIAVNVEIMRTFVRLRQILTSNADLACKLEDLERRYDRQFKVVFDAIRQLMVPGPTKKKTLASVHDQGNFDCLVFGVKLDTGAVQRFCDSALNG